MCVCLSVCVMTVHCNVVHNDDIGRRKLTKIQEAAAEGEASDMTVLMTRTKVIM